jgi:hypothetical protein
MDLVREIQRRLQMTSDPENLAGVKAAIHHIEVAERYLERGRNEEDGDAFNDVIYRCNQCFEGMLKEAYSAMHDGKDAAKMSPNQIEEDFSKNQKLKPRISDLFKNYRQQWRNPSTHDHTLLFSEQEAILAIASVSAFSMVLLGQIVEELNFQRQRKETTDRAKEFQTQLAKLSVRGLGEETVALLKLFYQDMKTKRQTIENEAELIGRFSGFVVTVEPDISTMHEAPVGEGRHADLILTRNGEKAILEFKRVSKRNLESAAQATLPQLTASTAALDAKSGVLFLWNRLEAPEAKSRQIESPQGPDIWLVGEDVT